MGRAEASGWAVSGPWVGPSSFLKPGCHICEMQIINGPQGGLTSGCREASIRLLCMGCGMLWSVVVAVAFTTVNFQESNMILVFPGIGGSGR